MCRRGVDDLALIPEKHISVCPSLRGLDDDYEEVKAAAQETSSLGAPGYSDFCGAVNSTQGETLHHIQGVPKKRTFRMVLEPQCTGSITICWQPLCLEIDFLVVSY